MLLVVPAEVVVVVPAVVDVELDAVVDVDETVERVVDVVASFEVVDVVDDGPVGTIVDLLLGEVAGVAGVAGTGEVATGEASAVVVGPVVDARSRGTMAVDCGVSSLERVMDSSAAALAAAAIPPAAIATAAPSSGGRFAAAASLPLSVAAAIVSLSLQDAPKAKTTQSNGAQRASTLSVSAQGRRKLSR